MKIMWTDHNAWKDGPKACFVADDYQPTDYDRAHAIAPPKLIDQSDWNFCRGDWAKLCETYPCPAPAPLPKVVKTE